MAETILVRARRQLGARLRRSAVADVVDVVSDLGAALTEVAGMLFGSGSDERTSGPSRGVGVGVGVGVPAARTPSSRIIAMIDLDDVRLGRRARRGSNTVAGRRLAAHGLRCHTVRRRPIFGLARGANAAAPAKKFRA
jgi:hypothetical protein